MFKEGTFFYLASTGVGFLFLNLRPTNPLAGIRKDSKWTEDPNWGRRKKTATLVEDAELELGGPQGCQLCENRKRQMLRKNSWPRKLTLFSKNVVFPPRFLTGQCGLWQPWRSRNCHQWSQGVRTLVGTKYIGSDVIPISPIARLHRVCHMVATPWRICRLPEHDSPGQRPRADVAQGSESSALYQGVLLATMPFLRIWRLRQINNSPVSQPRFLWSAAKHPPWETQLYCETHMRRFLHYYPSCVIATCTSWEHTSSLLGTCSTEWTSDSGESTGKKELRQFQRGFRLGCKVVNAPGDFVSDAVSLSNICAPGVQFPGVARQRWLRNKWTRFAILSPLF